jgi:tRNA threonylcarbamoyladenosine biosynthesis protein TsaE
MKSIFLADEDATLKFGAHFARFLRPSLTIFLHGDLGAGKTTLVRGVLRGLGFEGRVKSPTYTLVESYSVSSLYLYHFDLYRFKHEQEWLDAGFNEMFNDTTICFVEWPERAVNLMPSADVEIFLSVDGEGRRIELASSTLDVAACHDQWASAVA